MWAIRKFPPDTKSTLPPAARPLEEDAAILAKLACALVDGPITELDAELLELASGWEWCIYVISFAECILAIFGSCLVLAAVLKAKSLTKSFEKCAYHLVLAFSGTYIPRYYDQQSVRGCSQRSRNVFRLLFRLPLRLAHAQRACTSRSGQSARIEIGVEIAVEIGQALSGKTVSTADSGDLRKRNQCYNSAKKVDMQPPGRIELPTPSLRDWCSATELRRRVCKPLSSQPTGSVPIISGFCK